MPAIQTSWIIVVAAAVVAISTGIVGSAISPSSIEAKKKAFRRPAESVETGRADQDPVWQLGRSLFFDTVASDSGRTSCATCHQPDRSWSDTHPLAIGDDGQPLSFKAPTLLNVGSLDRLGWTGRFADTASVSLFAMRSTTMNMPVKSLLDRLRARPAYVALFNQAFAHQDITTDDVGTALARYVNSITSARSSFDSWVEGDGTAISADAKRGFAIFVGKGHCNECHSGWAFTDGSFHDIGSTDSDPGRGRYFPTSLMLRHAYKTPSLRGVAQRTPYMHDGSKTTLDEVIELYNRGGVDRPSRAEAIRPLHLSDQEKADLKAFLAALSGPTTFMLTPSN